MSCSYFCIVLYCCIVLCAFVTANTCVRKVLRNSRTQLPEVWGFFSGKPFFLPAGVPWFGRTDLPTFVRDFLILLRIARLSFGTRPLIDGLLLFGARLRLGVAHWWVGAVWVRLLWCLGTASERQKCLRCAWDTWKKLIGKSASERNWTTILNTNLVHTVDSRFFEFLLGTLLNMERTWEDQLNREWYLIGPGTLMALLNEEMKIRANPSKLFIRKKHHLNTFRKRPVMLTYRL